MQEVIENINKFNFRIIYFNINMKENLKVLMINGSPKANGNTAIALREMENVFKENGVEAETVVIGNQEVRGCIACGSCTFVCPAKRPLMQLFKQTKSEIMAAKRKK